MSAKLFMSALVVTTRSAQWRMISCRGFGPIRSSGASGRIAGRTASSARSSLSSTTSAPLRVDPTYYRGRDMALAHRGMRINESDWNVFLGHAAATLAKFKVPDAEQAELVKFVQSLKKDIVE